MLSSVDAFIGARSGSSLGFDGVIHEQIILNRRLTAGEVAEHYADPFAALRSDHFVLLTGQGGAAPAAGNPWAAYAQQ